MEWNARYSLGIPSIDAQHRQLFRLDSDLREALANGLSASQLNSCLERLGQYAVLHFSLEEKLMRDNEYPELARQQLEHKEFAQMVQGLSEQLHTLGLHADLPTLLHSRVSVWIREHVTGLDKAFGHYYRNRQRLHIT